MNQTYLTTEQLSELIHYAVRTIRNRLKRWAATHVDGDAKHFAEFIGGRTQSHQRLGVEPQAASVADMLISFGSWVYPVMGQCMRAIRSLRTDMPA